MYSIKGLGKTTITDSSGSSTPTSVILTHDEVSEQPAEDVTITA